MRRSLSFSNPIKTLAASSSQTALPLRNASDLSAREQGSDDKSIKASPSSMQSPPSPRLMRRDSSIAHPDVARYRELRGLGKTPFGQKNASENTSGPSDFALVNDTAIVGVGTAGAAVANIMAEEPEPIFPVGGAIFIGMHDGWDPKERGKAIISHQYQLMAPWDKEPAPYDPKFVNSLELVAANRKQIDKAVRAGAALMPDLISKIVAKPEGGYELTTKDGQCIHTKNVIWAGGVGPFTIVGGRRETEAEKRLENISVDRFDEIKNKVMNINDFTRATDAHPENFRGKKAVFHGTNAWSAVERASELGMDILHWMIRGDPPDHFDGTNLKHVPVVAEDKLINVSRLNIAPQPEGEGIRLRYAPLGDTELDSQMSELTADFYMYSLGQDIDAEFAVRKVLGDDIIKQMKPIYDLDQGYSKPWETVLGLEAKGTAEGCSVKVLGGALYVLARIVPHTYIEDELKRLEETLAEVGVDGNIGRDLLRQLETCESGSEINEKFTGWLNKHSLTLSQSAASGIRLHVENLSQAKDYLHGKANVSKEAENQSQNNVASITNCSQLAAVRGAVAEYGHFTPPYIAKGQKGEEPQVNLAADSRNNLQKYLALLDVDAESANTYVDLVVEIRMMKEATLRMEIAKKLVSNPNNLEEVESIAKSLPLVGIPVRGMPKHVEEEYKKIFKDDKNKDKNIEESKKRFLLAWVEPEWLSKEFPNLR